mmetsp:Transcript_40226/g.126623  ORF Transcript_40226/g.126623 Transcript_40226/m.126623 type:complete len:215 (+) Transcript_40226:117-761(+)
MLGGERNFNLTLHTRGEPATCLDPKPGREALPTDIVLGPQKFAQSMKLPGYHIHASSDSAELSSVVREGLFPLLHSHHDRRDVINEVDSRKAILQLAEVVGNRVLVGVDDCSVKVMELGRNDLDVVLEGTRPLVQHLHLPVQGVLQPRVVAPEGEVVHDVRRVDRRAVGKHLGEHVEILRVEAQVEVARHLLGVEGAVNVASLVPLQLLLDVGD